MLPVPKFAALLLLFALPDQKPLDKRTPEQKTRALLAARTGGVQLPPEPSN